MGDYSDKKREEKKEKTKKYYQANKENYKKDCESIIEMFQKKSKLKKEIKVTVIKICHTQIDRKRKKNI